MIKLGLVSAILPDMTFEDLIKYAAGVGFTCAEVCCWPRGNTARRYAGITHIDVEDKAYEGNIADVKTGIEQSYRFMRQYL